MRKWIDRLAGAAIIIGVVTAYSWATDREELYQQFGPKLDEAVVRVMIDEINLLRAEHGLSERTTAQLMNAVDVELTGLEDYDWMAE